VVVHSFFYLCQPIATVSIDWSLLDPNMAAGSVDFVDIDQCLFGFTPFRFHAVPSLWHGQVQFSFAHCRQYPFLQL
jgi:hypothetical protein